MMKSRRCLCCYREQQGHVNAKGATECVRYSVADIGEESHFNLVTCSPALHKTNLLINDNQWKKLMKTIKIFHGLCANYPFERKFWAEIHQNFIDAIAEFFYWGRLAINERIIWWPTFILWKQSMTMLSCVALGLCI